jgi:hypothetical protein
MRAVRFADLYLALAILVVIAAAVIGAMRRDLVRPMLVLGALGGLWGPVSEYWFFLDYWRPEGVFGRPWIEDILFGAGISALAAGLYPFVARRSFIGRDFARRRLAVIPLFVIGYVAAMAVLQGGLRLNSIVVATLVNVAVTTSIVIARRDLLVPAAVTALLVACGSAAGYALGLDLVVDGNAVLRRIWLLSGTPLGVTIFGNVPLTEITWYASWSAMTGVGYPYVAGARFASRLARRQPV